jgi:FkbM family methyltransferase
MTKSRVSNTEIFFQLLVKYLKPEIICDIGTLDASHSILLRHISRIPRIIAFEANPYNFNKIIDRHIPETENIEVFHKAVTNKAGELVFHVQKYTDSNEQKWMAGTSSILQRNVDVGETEEVNVDAIRLDQFLNEIEPDINNKSIALWIDVEGAGYEVLEGITDISSQIIFIQVEVETEEIWQGQKLKKDVLELVQNLGFIELGRGKHEKQHDLILINKEYFMKNRNICIRLSRLSVIFYYVRKWGGHIFSNILLTPILGISRHK